MNYINKEKLKEDIDKALDQAQEKASDYRSMAQEKMMRAREMAHQKREHMKQYVRENPEKSVLIAAGVGMVIGALLSAKKKKHGCKHCM